MPGLVLAFNQATNTFFKELYTKINKKENLINLNIIPHISLMRFSNLDNLDVIQETLTQFIDIKTFQVKINAISIFQKPNKFILVLDPLYDNKISKIHNKIWDKLSSKVDLKDEKLYNPNICSLHLTINLNNPNKDNLKKVLDYILDIPRESFDIVVDSFKVISKEKIFHTHKFNQHGNGIPLEYCNE